MSNDDGTFFYLMITYKDNEETLKMIFVSLNEPEQNQHTFVWKLIHEKIALVISLVVVTLFFLNLELRRWYWCNFYWVWDFRARIGPKFLPVRKRVNIKLTRIAVPITVPAKVALQLYLEVEGSYWWIPFILKIPPVSDTLQSWKSTTMCKK